MRLNSEAVRRIINANYVVTNGNLEPSENLRQTMINLSVAIRELDETCKIALKKLGENISTLDANALR